MPSRRAPTSPTPAAARTMSPTVCAAASSARTSSAAKATQSTTAPATASSSISTARATCNPYQIQVCDLVRRRWRPGPTSPPAGRRIAVDPQLGRLALPPAARRHAHHRQVSYYYGFNADMGGGEYARASATFTARRTKPHRSRPRRPCPHMQRGASPRAPRRRHRGQNSPDPTSEPAGAHHQPARRRPHRAPRRRRRPPHPLLGDEIVITGGAQHRRPQRPADRRRPCHRLPSSPAALLHAPTRRRQLSSPHLNLTHCTLVPGWSVQPQGEPNRLASLPTLLVGTGGLRVNDRPLHPRRVCGTTSKPPPASPTPSSTPPSPPASPTSRAATPQPTALSRRRTHPRRLHRHRQSSRHPPHASSPTASSGPGSRCRSDGDAPLDAAL